MTQIPIVILIKIYMSLERVFYCGMMGSFVQISGSILAGIIYPISNHVINFSLDKLYR